MEELVFKSKKGTPVTTSLLVAEKFGKEPKHVNESIRNLVAENSTAKSWFIESQYVNRGKEYPMYVMNRDGFTLLVMGFTGSDALKFKIDFINAFNKMEEALRTGGFEIPQTFAEALRLAAKKQEDNDRLLLENKQLETKIEEDAPRVLFSKAVEGSKKSVLIKDLATVLKQNGVDIGQNRLFVWLRENGYLCSVKGDRYNLPTQKSMDGGWFEIRKSEVSKPDGTKLVNSTPVVTPKGQIYFVNKFLKETEINYFDFENAQPLIDRIEDKIASALDVKYLDAKKTISDRFGKEVFDRFEIFLINNGALTEFVRLFDNSWYKKYHTEKLMMVSAFRWSSTTQGHAYWKDLSDGWVSICDKENR